MKNQLLLTMALGLAGATSLTAGTVDVYITGSTAFRANAYTACTKLYSSAPTIYYADGAHGGGSQGLSKSPSWVMTGSPATSLTNLQGNTLVIHGLFTGSIQGLQSVENSQKLTWAQPVGSGSPLISSSYVNNSPTIAFSDCSGSATPFPATGNYVEENVCVQPFVVVKSQGNPSIMTNITNLSWEQYEYGVPNGFLPLESWDNNMSDTNVLVYILQRTKDSGTRRCSTQGNYYQYNDPVGSFIWDATNADYYYANNLTVATNFNNGFSNSPTAYATVIGSEGPGLGNANLAWGPGYIGGGDIANALAVNNNNNNAIAMLSMGDAKSVVSGSNWANVISFNGLWPTRAGVGIHGNTGTNDFSPITLGFYPIWGYEVIVYPSNPATVAAGDQDISANQLGTGGTPGTFLGVFNAQSFNNGGTVIAGSVENEIVLSQPGGATGIPLAAMVASRASVGGLITPTPTP